VILIFYGISWNCFYIGKVMDQVYGSWDNDWLSVHGELTTMGRRNHSRAWEVVVMAQRERERRSLGFPQMAPLGGEAAETATQRRLIEATSGALMGKWFQARR
jgi:hypothetical protein